MSNHYLQCWGMGTCSNSTPQTSLLSYILYNWIRVCYWMLCTLIGVSLSEPHLVRSMAGMYAYYMHEQVQRSDVLCSCRAATLLLHRPWHETSLLYRPWHMTSLVGWVEWAGWLIRRADLEGINCGIAVISSSQGSRPGRLIMWNLY